MLVPLEHVHYGMAVMELHCSVRYALHGPCRGSSCTAALSRSLSRLFRHLPPGVYTLHGSVHEGGALRPRSVSAPMDPSSLDSLVRDISTLVSSRAQSVDLHVRTEECESSGESDDLSSVADAASEARYVRPAGTKPSLGRRACVLKE